MQQAATAGAQNRFIYEHKHRIGSHEGKPNCLDKNGEDNGRLAVTSIASCPKTKASRGMPYHHALPPSSIRHIPPLVQIGFESR